MLYLFNSAFREKYSANLLNTFFLDSNSTNEYRYSTINVDPKIIAANGILAEKDALVLFIDRHDETGFLFHPVRRATYLKHETRGDQVYFQLRLGDFLYPANIEEFQQAFRSSFAADGLPHPTSAGPDSKAAGYFAMTGRALPEGQVFTYGDQAWIAAVESVAQTRSFAGKNAVFLRGSVRKQNGELQLPDSSATGSCYRLIRGKHYRLQLYYRFPAQDTNHDARANISVAAPNLILPLSHTEIHINSRNSTEYVDFAVKEFPEHKDGIISLSSVPVPAGTGAEEVLLPDSSLTVRSTRSLSFWPLAALLLVLYSVLGVFAGADFDKLLAPLIAAKQLTTMQGMQKSLLVVAQDNWLAVKIATTVLQAIVVLALVRLIGKKPD